MDEREGVGKLVDATSWASWAVALIARQVE